MQNQVACMTFYARQGQSSSRSDGRNDLSRVARASQVSMLVFCAICVYNVMPEEESDTVLYSEIEG